MNGYKCQCCKRMIGNDHKPVYQYLDSPICTPCYVINQRPLCSICKICYKCDNDEKRLNICDKDDTIRYVLDMFYTLINNVTQVYTNPKLLEVSWIKGRVCILLHANVRETERLVKGWGRKAIKSIEYYDTDIPTQKYKAIIHEFSEYEGDETSFGIYYNPQDRPKAYVLVSFDTNVIKNQEEMVIVFNWEQDQSLWCETKNEYWPTIGNIALVSEFEL